MSLQINRDYIDNLLNSYIEKNYKRDSIEEEMARYCLFGGKAVRPLIIRDIFLSNLGNSTSTSTGLNIYLCNNLMIAIELLHTASLILDDMPFMDDDIMRRGKACLHVKFDINSSKKLTNLFINHSIKLIYEVVNDNTLIKNVLDILQDTTFGQYIDLFNKIPEKADIYKKCDLLCLKTSTLFNLAFLFGAISINATKEKQAEFIEMGSLFGKLFQISDDFEDYIEDLEKERKMNHLILLGRSDSLKLFTEFKTKLETSLRDNNCYSELFAKLIKKMSSRI